MMGGSVGGGQPFDIFDSVFGGDGPFAGMFGE